MNQIVTAAEAEKAIAQLSDLIEQLRGLLEEETALVQAGKVRKAIALGLRKSQLAGELFVACERLKENAAFVVRTAPESAAALHRQQAEFRGLLEKNRVALATAHAVSEGIVRRLSGELARKASPRVYGASGRTIAPDPKHGKPLAISRTL